MGGYMIPGGTGLPAAEEGEREKEGQVTSL